MQTSAMIDKTNIDYRVYLVLDPDLTAQLGMVETALAAAQAGAGLIQLRAPQWKKRAYFECAVSLKNALKPYGIPLIIDDHVDVALAAKADGVHVGQKDLPVEAVRQLVGPNMIVGLSINNMAQLQAMDPNLVDYIGVGPVYTTTTKKDAAAPIGIEGLSAIAQQSPVPVVGIGGINETRTVEIAQTAAHGVAVISAICGQADPAQATAKLLVAWQKGRQLQTSLCNFHRQNCITGRYTG